MRVESTGHPEVVRILPEIFEDSRGHFFEVYHAEKFASLGLPRSFVQDNQSGSRRGVLRGLHVQSVEPQGKLVRCLAGEIWDVAVDVRPGSDRFGCWVGIVLDSTAREQLWIPPGFAHGFVVLSDWAEVAYKCTSLYHPAADLTIAWDDPDLAIDWPVKDPILSPKDSRGRSLREVEAELSQLWRGGA